jgi:hypothetical protein
MSAEPKTAERRLANIGDLSGALSGATAALELAVAGIAAMDQEDGLPGHHADGLQHLAQHVAQLAEGIAALANDRPPRWRIHHVLADVPHFEVPK